MKKFKIFDLSGVLVLVTMMQFAVGGAVLPFIAFHLIDEGFSFRHIGEIFFFGSASALLFPFIWGYLSDRFIPLNQLFIILNLVAGILLIILERSSGLLMHQIVFAGYYAFYHPTIILINSLCFHHLKNPGQEFGKIRGLGSLGWILPSIPLFWIYSTMDSVPTGNCLYLAAGISITNALLCFFLPHTKIEKTKLSVVSEKEAEYKNCLFKLLRDKNFIFLMISLFFASASFAVLAFFSTPYLEELGISRAMAGPIQSIGVIAEVILMPLLPLFFSKFGYVRGLVFGLLCLFARHVTSYFFESGILFSWLYVLVGLMVIYYYTVASMALDRLAHSVVRSSAQTFMVMLGSGLGPMCANLAAGIIVDNSETNSLRPIFGFGSVLAFLSLLSLMPIYKSLRQFLDNLPAR